MEKLKYPILLLLPPNFHLNCHHEQQEYTQKNAKQCQRLRLYVCLQMTPNTSKTWTVYMLVNLRLRKSPKYITKFRTVYWLWNSLQQCQLRDECVYYIKLGLHVFLVKNPKEKLGLYAELNLLSKFGLSLLLVTSIQWKILELSHPTLPKFSHLN